LLATAARAAVTLASAAATEADVREANMGILTSSPAITLFL